MSVKIISDSACDMIIETRKKLGVEVIPINVIFDDGEYLDGIDFTHEEFMEKLIKSKNLPKTSLITPATYQNTFKEAISSGDDVVFISISSHLSGCYQSAVMAAREVDENKIFVVDSENASLGQYILVELATRLRDEGLSAKEIATRLDEEKKKIRLIALIDTLEFLQKGGRLSKAAAIVGSLISIKPVITVIDGEVTILGKARGTKKGSELVTRFAQLSGGFDYKKPIVFAYSGFSDKLLKEYIQANRHFVEGKMDVDGTPIITIGAAIGTHVGPNAIGIAFFSREEYKDL